MKRAISILGVLALLAAAGCSSTLKVKRSSRYDDQAPIRVAILPFEDESGGGAFSVLAAPFKAIADLFVSGSGAPPGEPATALREAIAANVRVTNIDLVDLRFVNTTLTHNGIVREGDLSGLRKTPARRLGDLLGADALLFGKVTTYRAEYYLAESNVTIGADLELIDVYTGAALWEATGNQSMSFGLSKGPTGYSSAVVEPIKGLRESNLWNVSAEFARNIGASLRGRAETEDEAQGPPPFVTLASSSVEEGARLEPGDVVRVVAVGSIGSRASFDIGGARRGIPMVEFGSGTYQGSYTVLEGDRFAGDVIVVTLRNHEGRAASVPLAKTPVISSQS